uniref:Uncharacterized protein n=1 Tax=Nelumbo nucifera TaxID=4432 RepID=A0A822ZD35_NELNU|nr:TPA_asm: hypothetical protein HUJ06_001047 [Nelumbo nucifera]
MEMSRRVLVSTVLCMVIVVSMLDNSEAEHCLSNCYRACNIAYELYDWSYILWSKCALQCTISCIRNNFDLSKVPSSSEKTKEALYSLSKGYIPNEDGLPQEIAQEIEIIKNENLIPPNITKTH